MTEGTVRQWCRMFKDGWTNVHDEKQCGQPSVVNDDLIHSVDQKICESQCFTISELLCEFPQISCTVSTRLSQARLSQVLHKMGSDNAHRCTQNKENGFGFLRAIPQRWWWVSQSHRTSNRWQNLDFICECRNQQALKAVDAHTFTKV
jgi:hypothetical protein